MKYIHILTVVIFLTTASCLSHRTSHKTSDVSYTSGREEMAAAGQWVQQLYGLDSSEMVWQFRTDAPFVYHPDTGLRAQNGWLQFRTHHVQQWHTHNDSTRLAVYRADSLARSKAQTAYSEKRPTHQNQVVWLIAVLVGIWLIARIKNIRL